MYDTFLIPNNLLPEKHKGRNCYQTKDLDCYLDTYEVLENGKVILFRFDNDECYGELCKMTTGVKVHDFDTKTRDYIELLVIIENGKVIDVKEVWNG